MKIGYLGPQGTFSEQAAITYTKNIPNCHCICYNSIHDVLLAVENGEVTEGVVPFENSIEGTVTSTIDSLIFDVNLSIIAEVIIPIRHNLIVNKLYNGEKITKIMSHPQALAQCRKFIQDNYPESAIEPVNSTAQSAMIVSQLDCNIAGISTARAAELFNNKILYKDIQDEEHNKTRFVVVTKPTNVTYFEKTTFVLYIDHKPGALYKILDIIALWDINMTKIESRPMKNELGKYVFLIDVEAKNLNDLKDCIKMLERKTFKFKLLGSYPVYIENEG